MRGCLVNRETKINIVQNVLGNSMAKICAITNASRTCECGVCGPTKRFEMRRATMMHGAPPLDLRQHSRRYQ